MSEPVGNANRSAAPLPGSNTHSIRQAAERANQPVEEREKVEKVITGKVVQKKPNIIKRVARGMVADDVTNVGDFVVSEVVMPAFRNLLYDIVSQGSHRVLFGTNARARRGMYAPAPGYGPVSNLKTAYHRAREESAPAGPQMSQHDQATHNFDGIFLDSHADAQEVLDQLLARVERYGFASVADFYGYLGVTGSFADQKHGWNDLSTASVRHARQGFTFDFPRAQPLR
jgi:hypothetical protein